MIVGDGAGRVGYSGAGATLEFVPQQIKPETASADAVFFHVQFQLFLNFRNNTWSQYPTMVSDKEAAS
jgi:hypothetical protein